MEINKQIYIASPLFNEQQIERIKFIEMTCEKFGVPYFSPRLHATPYEPTIEGRRATYVSDVAGIDASGLVLACLDWLLPEGKITCEVTLPAKSGDMFQSFFGESYKITPVDLNIPDPGTIIEVGYSKGIKTPSIGILTNPTPVVNLMITESCRAILPTMEIVRHFIANWAKATTQEDIDKLLNDYAELYIWEGYSQ